MTGTRLDVLRAIADDVAGPAAAAIDRESRFPQEAVAALGEHRLFAASVGSEDAPAWGYGELVEAARLLGRRCASTGMVWAMHHSQAWVVARHRGDGPVWDDAIARLAEGTRLLASAASEGHGDYLRSDALLTRDGPAHMRLVKQARPVSFGEQADMFLVTCRRPGGPGHGEVALALVHADQCDATVTGAWDALGMRGTASVPMTLTCRFLTTQVFPEPYEVIHRSTVVPAAHLLWAGCWVGIAEAALDLARGKLRRAPTPGTATVALSEAAGRLDLVGALVHDGVARFCAPPHRPTLRQSIESSRWFNEFKVQASSGCTAVVLAALRVLGMAGYCEVGELSVARAVRDILSSELMIGNHRLREVNASLDLVRSRSMSGPEFAWPSK